MYHFSELRWCDYLTSVPGAIYSVGMAQTREMKDMLDELGHNFSDEAEEVRDGLAAIADGFYDVQDSMDSLQGSIEALSEAFEEGCWLICERLDAQNNLLQNISKQIEQIHKVLKSSLATRAGELAALGHACFEKGLYRESVALYNQASELYGEDPLVQFQLGKLYFYAIDNGESLVNLDEAECHLLLAERDLPLLLEPISPFLRLDFMRKQVYRDHRRLKAQVEHNLAQLFFVRAGERIYERRKKACETLNFEPPDAAFRGRTKELLTRALQHAEAAVKEWKPLLNSRYLLASICASLGDRERATKELLTLGDLDRRHLLRAERDQVFLGTRIPTLVDIHALGEDGITNLAEEALKQARWWVGAAERIPLNKEQRESVQSFNQQLEKYEKNIYSRAAYPVRLYKPAGAADQRCNPENVMGNQN